MDGAAAVAGSRDIQRRQFVDFLSAETEAGRSGGLRGPVFFAVRLIILRMQVGWQQNGILMYLVHLEHMVRRGKNHLFLVGQDHGLQNVDRLGNVGHADPIGMLIHDVQGNSGYQSVPQTVLLIEKTGIGPRFDGMPGAPFIQNDIDTLLRIVFIHDRLMLGNQFVQEYGVFQLEKPIAFIELGCRTTFPAGAAIVVQG